MLPLQQLCPCMWRRATSRFVRDSVDSVVGMTVVTADESGSARVRKYTAQDPDWDAVR